MTPQLAWISVAPVKGLALAGLEEAVLERTGVRGDRAFHLVDGDGRLVNRKQLPRLAGVRAELAGDGELLTLRFPDGRVVTGSPAAGETVTTNFYGRPVTGTFVGGPWDVVLSEWARTDLCLVSVPPGEGHDRGPRGAVTIASTASLERLAAEAGAETVDERRFRMLLGVSGVAAHEEDTWLGREVAIGEAVVRPHAHVGRCAVTTQDPDTGEVTLDTLRLLKRYRSGVESHEPIPFGVWGEVVAPGRIRVGDPVRPG